MSTRVSRAFMSIALVVGGVSWAADKEASRMAVKPFALDRIRLLDGACKDAQEANRRYLHALEADRMLYNFRVTAGLDAPGVPLGGWEKPDCEVRGHFVGHYLSACALMYASAGDEALKAKADGMVAAMAQSQAALGGEYLSAYPDTFWDRLESLEKPPWAPYYTIHKIMAGMYDMYTLCGNEQALDVLKGMAAYFKKRIDALSIYQWDRVLGVEFGGMAEVGYNLYSITGDPAHLALAHAFDKAAFLGPLALEHDNLTRLHANTHIPEIIGAARRYEVLGDERYRTAVAYFWDRVAGTRSYATGGTSNAEHWPDPNALADTLSSQNQESCTSHNMLKVTRHLIAWTGDPRYADYYERTFFNSILGTQNPETGMLAYFTPLAAGHTKQFGTPNDSFWCCYGTGIESFAKLGDSIYFHNDDGIFVNLYVASAVDWREPGVHIEQRTRFPEQAGATLTVQCEKPVAFSLNLHVPYWATEGIEVLINDQPVEVAATPTSYARLRREWQDGDTIEVRLPMTLHVHPMPDDAALVAVMYGPVVLAGLSPEKCFFIGDPANPAAWIERIEGESLRFRTIGQAHNIEFIPLNWVVDKPYGVYYEVVQEGSARHHKLLAEEEARRRREARIVDRVTPGNEAIESAHNLQGENTLAGPYQGKHWRHASGGGWWSWDMKMLGDVPMTLCCTYWGDDVPPRTFDILIDGQVLATQSLDRDKPGEFFDVEYPVPEEWTKGRESVTVTFDAHEGNTAGGVFDCTMLRPQE